MGGRCQATNGRASHPKRSTCRVATALGVSSLEFSLLVKHDTQIPREGGGCVRRLLVRGFVVLGGSVAVTAIAWGIGAGTAAAEEFTLDPRLAAITESESSGALEDLASTLSGEPLSAEIDDVLVLVGTRSTPSLRMYLPHDSTRCAADVVNCTGSLGEGQGQTGSMSTANSASTPAEQPLSFPARSLTTAHEVVAAEGRAPARDDAGHVPARQLRTTSGLDAPAQGPGDAFAHTPAPELLAATAPAASGCATGSSLTSTVLGELCAFGPLGSGSGELVLPGAAGRTSVTGAQPGVAPD